MENIIKKISEKSGISESQAKTALDVVVSFLKDKMPAGIGGQVESFIKGNAGSVTDNIKEKLSDVFGK